NCAFVYKKLSLIETNNTFVMKKIYTRLGLSFFIMIINRSYRSFPVMAAILFICSPALGQTPYRVGKANEFISAYTQMPERAKTPLPMKVSDSRELQMIVNVNRSKPMEYEVIGEVVGHPTSTFFFDGETNKFEGKIILYQSKEAFNFYSDDAGNLWVEETDINKILCVDYQLTDPDEETPAENAVPEFGERAAQPQDMESFPGATGCLYLDFDGEYVSG